MCAVSAVTDYYKELWPTPYKPWIPEDWLRKAQEAPTDKTEAVLISKKEWDHYQALKKRMEEYDKATGQAHCEKPDVEAWEKSLIDAGCIKDV